MPNKFSEAYTTGQPVRLVDHEGGKVADAIVLNYDPTRDNARPSGMSKARPPSPNHWHIAVHEPASDEWLPAAIWENSNGGYFGAHLTRENNRSVYNGDSVIYTNEELARRVSAIAINVDRVKET